MGQGDEEELIGDTLLTSEGYYYNIGGRLRARFLITLDGNSDSTERMFVRPNLPNHRHPWGWFTAQVDNYICLHPFEHHDVAGDGTVDSTQLERHCVANGPHTVRLWRVTWDAQGTAYVLQDTLFVRQVAMLGTGGSFDTEPLSSLWYHDVHLTFDMTDATIGFAGDLRAGTYYLSGADPAVYAERDTFTIGERDSLWFQSTFVATGTDGRSWYNNTAAVLTGFSFDYDNDQFTFTGGVNSRPGPETSAAFWHFVGREDPYRVVGRVVAPTHHEMGNGLKQADSSLYVTSLPLHACFGVSGFRVTGQLLNFDGHCSTGADTLEYRWTFGDGSAVNWSRDSVVVHHTYSAAGSLPATLRVRAAGTTGPVDSTTQTLSIVGPVWVHINGYDAITQSGTYTWTSQPHDGALPYGPYGWYYQEEGSGESLVGTEFKYLRYILVKSPPYTFRLRNTVQDAIPTSAEDTLWVDVVPEGDRSSSLGLLDARGACRLLPADFRARQAAHAAIARTGRWPTLCLGSAP